MDIRRRKLIQEESYTNTVWMDAVLSILVDYSLSMREINDAIQMLQLSKKPIAVKLLQAAQRKARLAHDLANIDFDPFEVYDLDEQDET